MIDIILKIIIICELLGILIVDILHLAKKPNVQEKKVLRREIPKNIGRFADPIGNYEPYKDDVSHLYKSYIPKQEKKINRRGGDINE